MSTAAAQTITVAWTGASGMGYGLRLLTCLLTAGCRVYLLVSPAARLVLKQEMDLQLPSPVTAAALFLRQHLSVDDGELTLFSPQQWDSPVASGSARIDAMIICPCSSGTLAAIACGSSDNLMERAADVMLKENRPLILMPREMPLSAIHLEHMLRLARLGVVMMPPNPGFYHRPQSIAEVVDFVVARALDHLGVAHQLLPRWGQDQQAP